MLRLTQPSIVLAFAGLLAGPTVADAKAAPFAGPNDPHPEVQAQMERGDDLFAQRKFSAARRAYDKAAEIARAEGLLPDKPLRRLANVYYFEGRFKSAAKVLDELAEEAAAYGELPTQVLAVVDAAWLHGKLGSKREVDRRLARVERLLASPYMPEEVRDRITTFRLGDPTTVSLR